LFFKKNKKSRNRRKKAGSFPFSQDLKTFGSPADIGRLSELRLLSVGVTFIGSGPPILIDFSTIVG
jgi:hypothetical protein